MSKAEIKTITDIKHSITQVPWDYLAHAYHSAWDAPKMLEAFVEAEPSEQVLAKSVDWLWGSILHQGSIYSASAPVIWILIDLLSIRPNHQAASDILYAIQTIAEGLDYFGDSQEITDPILKSKPGEPLYEVRTEKALPRSGDDAGEDYFTACIVTTAQLHSLLKHAIPVISRSLNNPDAKVRNAAVATALCAFKVQPNTEELKGLHKAIGDPTYDPGAWISIAMILGQLGEDTTALLEHSDPRIQLAAAMSPSTQDNEACINILASAVSNPEWLEAEFPNGVAHIAMHLRFHVLAALLERTDPNTADSFIKDSLCRLIRKKSGKYTVDYEWGRILHWAFKDRLVELPQITKPGPLPDALTTTQAAILQALCSKEELWDPTNGNASLTYKRVQLPYDRKVLCKLVKASP